MKNTQQIKMDEELDLYNDILINDSMDGRAASLEELKLENRSQQVYINSLLKQVSQLTEKNDKLQKTCDTATHNCKLACVTARKELDRKDQTIEDLKTRLEYYENKGKRLNGSKKPEFISSHLSSKKDKEKHSSNSFKGKRVEDLITSKGKGNATENRDLRGKLQAGVKRKTRFDILPENKEKCDVLSHKKIDREHKSSLSSVERTIKNDYKSGKEDNNQEINKKHMSITRSKLKFKGVKANTNNFKEIEDKAGKPENYNNRAKPSSNENLHSKIIKPNVGFTNTGVKRKSSPPKAYISRKHSRSDKIDITRSQSKFKDVKANTNNSKEIEAKARKPENYNNRARSSSNENLHSKVTKPYISFTNTGVKRKSSPLKIDSSRKDNRSDNNSDSLEKSQTSRHPKKLFKLKYLESEEEKKLASLSLQSTSNNESDQSRSLCSAKSASSTVHSPALDNEKSLPSTSKLSKQIKTNGHLNETNSLHINNKVGKKNKDEPLVKSLGLPEPTKSKEKFDVQKSNDKNLPTILPKNAEYLDMQKITSREGKLDYKEKTNSNAKLFIPATSICNGIKRRTEEVAIRRSSEKHENRAASNGNTQESAAEQISCSPIKSPVVSDVKETRPVVNKSATGASICADDEEESDLSSSDEGSVPSELSHFSVSPIVHSSDDDDGVFGDHNSDSSEDEFSSATESDEDYEQVEMPAEALGTLVCSKQVADSMLKGSVLGSKKRSHDDLQDWPSPFFASADRKVGKKSKPRTENGLTEDRKETRMKDPKMYEVNGALQSLLNKSNELLEKARNPKMYETNEALESLLRLCVSKFDELEENGVIKKNSSVTRN